LFIANASKAVYTAVQSYEYIIYL